MDDEIEFDDPQEQTLRYCEGERQLFVEVVVGPPCTIFTSSARHWTVPKGVPLTDAELALAVERMVGYLVERGLGPVTIDERRPGM